MADAVEYARTCVETRCSWRTSSPRKEGDIYYSKLLLVLVLTAAALLVPGRPVAAGAPRGVLQNARSPLETPPHPLLAAILTGEAEVPGPSDRNGRGVALLSFHPYPDQAQGTVCFVIRVQNIALPITAAHIHRGAAGEAGPIVVGLFEGTDEDGVVKGCVRRSRRSSARSSRTRPATTSMCTMSRFRTGRCAGSSASAASRWPALS
jgi:hypothetical protein